MNNLLLYFNTLKYLKLKQFQYRIFYKLRSLFGKKIYSQYALTKENKAYKVILKHSIINHNIFFKQNIFVFLNIRHSFDKSIDWNYPENGKLWTYNLTYFEFLQQKVIDKEEGLKLIHDFIQNIKEITDGLEPFPISIRGINWIKFLSQHYHTNDTKINNSLYLQYEILMDNIEYHILGNHLLENGFSLLFAAYYFHDERFYRKALEILESELEEQILSDGGHFELSPMYHQLMLFRVFDCINLVKNNRWKERKLLEFLVDKAEIMLGWLNTMTYNNGDIPLFNDSSNNIAPSTKQLNDYALVLNVKARILALNDSGYRKISNKYYEILIDVGNIGPDYIPGHAHSDTFNFELYVANVPLIIDKGISTYEVNNRRQTERSTKSHNTVEVDGENQSEVWGGFRVAKRAKIIDFDEKANYLSATHDGYKKKGVLHKREFIIKEKKIIIRDIVQSKNNHECIGYLHFHPNVNITLIENILICSVISVKCTGRVELIEYEYSPEFNTGLKAQCAKIYFNNELTTEIIINGNN